MSAKVSDRFSAALDLKAHRGYVPGGLNVGEGDYVEFSVCLDCGQSQGGFPVPREAEDAAFPLRGIDEDDYTW